MLSLWTQFIYRYCATDIHSVVTRYCAKLTTLLICASGLSFHRSPIYVADEQSQHLFPSQSRSMLLRELSTEVKTNSSYKGRSAVYSLVTIVIFHPPLPWSTMFSTMIFFVHHGYVSTVYPLPTDPFYRIEKFYEGINRRYIHISLRETCIRIGLFLILLANVLFYWSERSPPRTPYESRDDLSWSCEKKEEMCSDVNKYLFITKRMEDCYYY